MEILENIDVILSVICAIGSIVMFFKTKHEKEECVKIHTEIKNDLKIINDSKRINSKDEFNIEQVKNFDNRKTIT